MLVTLDQFKDANGITGYDQDDFLTAQLELVSDAVEVYCSRLFASDDYIETFYKEDMIDNVKKPITLFNFPVTAITSVVERYDETDMTGTTITGYRYHSPTGILTKNFGENFFCNGRILEVTYTGGYTAIPSIVKYVINSIVQERYNKKINGIDVNFGSSVQRVSLSGVGSIDFDYSLESNQQKSHLGQVLGDYRNMLDPYRSERVLPLPGRLAYVAEA